MLVIVTGGYRTGSTLAYNIAAEFAERCGGRRCSGLTPMEFAPVDALAKMVKESKGTVHVWKSHTYRPRLVVPGVNVIHTMRCPYATAGSNQRIKEFDKQRLVTIVQEIRWQQAENPVISAMSNCLSLKYAAAVPDPSSWVSAIGMRFFGSGAAPLSKILEVVAGQKMKEVADSLEPDCIDERTELRHGHISDKWQDLHAWEKFIDPCLREEICSMFWKHECEECLGWRSRLG